MTSRLIQSIIVDRSEIGQDNTGLPIFTLTGDDITDIAETIVKQLAADEDNHRRKLLKAFKEWDSLNTL